MTKPTREEEIKKRVRSLEAQWWQCGQLIHVFIRELAESFQLHVEQHRIDAEILSEFYKEERRRKAEAKP